MKKGQKMSLISGVVFFLLGLVIFLNPETIVKFVSYCLGGLLIVLGIYKCVNYYIQDKRLGIDVLSKPGICCLFQRRNTSCSEGEGDIRHM